MIRPNAEGVAVTQHDSTTNRDADADGVSLRLISHLTRRLVLYPSAGLVPSFAPRISFFLSYRILAAFAVGGAQWS